MGYPNWGRGNDEAAAQDAAIAKAQADADAAQADADAAQADVDAAQADVDAAQADVDAINADNATQTDLAQVVAAQAVLDAAQDELDLALQAQLELLAVSLGALLAETGDVVGVGQAVLSSDTSRPYINNTSGSITLTGDTAASLVADGLSLDMALPSGGLLGEAGTEAEYNAKVALAVSAGDWFRLTDSFTSSGPTPLEVVAGDYYYTDTGIQLMTPAAVSMSAATGVRQVDDYSPTSAIEITTETTDWTQVATGFDLTASNGMKIELDFSGFSNVTTWHTQVVQVDNLMDEYGKSILDAGVTAEAYIPDSGDRHGRVSIYDDGLIHIVIFNAETGVIGFRAKNQAVKFVSARMFDSNFDGATLVDDRLSPGDVIQNGEHYFSKSGEWVNAGETQTIPLSPSPANLTEAGLTRVTGFV